MKKEENDNQSTENSFKIISLKNPATKKSAKYMIRSEPKEIYELMCFSDPLRSWFINESVCSNGKIYVPTKIDPLFLIIPHFEKNCSDKAIPIDHVFDDDAHCLQDFVTSEDLELISDEKKAGKICAYKYSEEKTLNWLKAKCLKLEQNLMKQKKFTQLKNYIKNEKENTEEDSEYLIYAHGLISDYLSLDLSKKLGKHIGLPEDKLNRKRKSEAIPMDENIAKKLKKEEVKTEDKTSSKAKALAKAAKGSKSISSFFTKK